MLGDSRNMYGVISPALRWIELYDDTSPHAPESERCLVATAFRCVTPVPAPYLVLRTNCVLMPNVDAVATRKSIELLFVG